MNFALLLLRLVAGLVMAAHGAQKLFGWFGGYGIAGTAGFFEQLGFRPGRAFATAAALASRWSACTGRKGSSRKTADSSCRSSTASSPSSSR